MKKTNIEEKLNGYRDTDRSGDQLLQEIKNLLAADSAQEEAIREKILSKTDPEEEEVIANDFDLDLLETGRIFHEDQLKHVCDVYRLRFLDSYYFKKELPYEAVRKVKALEKLHKTQLKGFKIMAPAKAFRLKNADDPLLFAPIGNGYHYLIHKWGNDLHPLRKILVWPWRRLENMIIFLILLTIAITAVLPKFPFPGEITLEKFLMIAFMLFPWIVGLMVFYFVKKGKNFSPVVWKSTYFNG